MLKLFNVQLFLIFSMFSFSQTFNGKALIWNLVENPDPRISIKSGTTGINIGGYEGTALVIKNLTDKKIHLALSQVITDFCGVDVVRNPSFTLMPNETIGGSTFFGGSEQYDFSPACKERKKYSDDFTTRISSIKMRLTAVKDLQTDITTNSKDKQETQKLVQEETSYYDIINKAKTKTSVSKNSPNADLDFWGYKIVSPDKNAPLSGSSNATFISDKCTPQRIGILGNIGADCVPLTFISEKTIQFNSSTSEIRTDNSPDNFVLSYKRSDDLIWSEKEVIGNQIRYNLVGLDPCTKYEIKIQRNCGNGERSKPTIPLECNTTCSGVSQIQAVYSTSTEIKLRYFLRINMNTCSNNAIKKRIAFEYKSQADISWSIAEFNMGTAPILKMLKPNTSYMIRAKVLYPNNKYSTYSTAVSIKTK